MTTLRHIASSPSERMTPSAALVRTALRSVVVSLLSLIAMQARAQAQFEPPKLNNDGSMQVPTFTLPYSSLASPEAKAAFIESQRTPVPIAAMPGAGIAEIRQAMDEKFFAPLIAKQDARYRVAMHPQVIGGVYTQVFEPQEGIAIRNRHRLLINLHGGGFLIGSRTQSQIESIPIAAVGHIRVISIDYRLAPENHFPAASEDVAAVYKELLKTTAPENIGIYGCSAGGTLSGEAIAWFQHIGLPSPAAIGIFCASTRGIWEGDSAYVSARLGGTIPPPPSGADLNGFGPEAPYFIGASPNDPLAMPSASTVVLQGFPPTLLITGTRAAELSGAVKSHIELVNAGVDARLFVWEAMDHGFLGNPDLPESREAYGIIVNFFDNQFGRKRSNKAH